VIRC